MKLYFEFDCLDIFAKPGWQSPSSMFHFLKSSSATRGEIFILKFTKYSLVAGLRPNPLGEGRGGKRRGKIPIFAPQPKNRSRAYATSSIGWRQTETAICPLAAISSSAQLLRICVVAGHSP